MDREDFKDDLREAFLERFDGIENEDGERNEDYEPEQYWDDALMDLADEAVPMMTNDLYELWMGLGRPTVSDPGLIEGIHDIDRIVQISVYDTAREILYEIAEEFDLR